MIAVNAGIGRPADVAELPVRRNCEENRDGSEIKTEAAEICEAFDIGQQTGAPAEEAKQMKDRAASVSLAGGGHCKTATPWGNHDHAVTRPYSV